MLLAVCVLAGAWLFVTLTPVLISLLVALIFAGTLDPAVQWLERRGLRRALALGVVFGVFALVVVRQGESHSGQYQASSTDTFAANRIACTTSGGGGVPAIDHGSSRIGRMSTLLTQPAGIAATETACSSKFIRFQSRQRQRPGRAPLRVAAQLALPDELCRRGLARRKSELQRDELTTRIASVRERVGEDVPGLVAGAA